MLSHTIYSWPQKKEVTGIFFLLWLALSFIAFRIQAGELREGEMLAVEPVSAPTTADEQELEEIVISAPIERKVEDQSRPVSVLAGEALRTQMAPTIGATLSQQPGINNQSFGPGVGQPVIRGLSGPRVRVMENGIGNNDVSNISPDHANSIEPSQAERIEVLRGPSTLLFGSGAIGGIVNVIDNRVPEKSFEQDFQGGFNEIYNSALQETSSSLRMEGGTSQFAYHVDGFFRNSGNELIGGSAIDIPSAIATDPELANLPEIQNTYGYVANTHARAEGGTLGMSMVGDYGFAGGAYNYLQNDYGVPPIGIPGDPSVRINMKQSKYDFRGGIDQPAEWIDRVKYKFGYTDYQHVESEAGVAGTNWQSQSYENRLELSHAPLGPLRGQWGFQFLNGETSAIGAEAILPQTTIANYGIFAVETLETDPIVYDFGLRVEPQQLTPVASSLDPQRSFLPVSSSFSGIWKIDRTHSLSLAFTESQRGAQAQELYVDGAHQATRAYEIGNPNLTMESSYNLEMGYTFKHEGITAEANLFNNWVDNYIYSQYTGRLWDNQLPIFRVEQANALFRGFESNLTIPLYEGSHGLIDVNLFGDYTRGTLSQAGNGNVPRMPPLRYGAQLDFTYDACSTFLRVTRGNRQGFAGENETQTPGWVLMNLGVQYQTKASANTQILFYARGNNLLNQNIRNSTSYLKNYAPEPGRGVQVGIEIRF